MNVSPGLLRRSRTETVKITSDDPNAGDVEALLAELRNLICDVKPDSLTISVRMSVQSELVVEPGAR